LRAVAADTGSTLDELTKATKNWSPETIRAVQRRLQREGYYQGAFDGRTGPKLRQPLERWRNVGSLFPNNG
jgi:peptidoglycan hydrolase-like protein with peptidoglycan-binding domain